MKADTKLVAQTEAILEERYNARAKKYDQNHFVNPKHLYWFRHEVELLASFLRVDKGLSLLDVAGGTGRISAELALRGADVEIADISPKMLSKAREEAKRRRISMKVTLASASNLPYPDAHFDCVMSTKFFHNVPKALHHIYIGEMARVVKSRGLIAFEFSNALAGFGLYPIERLRRRLSGRSNTPWYWPTEIRPALQKYDLQVEKVNGMGFALPFTYYLVTKQPGLARRLLQLVSRPPLAWGAAKVFVLARKR